MQTDTHVVPANATRVAPDDEVFWAGIRAQYTVSPDFINLEHGYFSLQAQPVFEAFQRYQTQVNAESTFFMRQQFPMRLEEVRRALAVFCGVQADELLITRNVIESMNILLQGYPLVAGDAVVCAGHDYDRVLETLEMLQQRKGVALQQIEVPLDPDSDAQIVDCYAQAITPRTRLMLVTHMVHRTGQILPVAQIAAMARSRGVDVVVDAAHSFAQLAFDFPSLNSDFIAVNLHKWLGAPLGVGLLYIRKARIGDIAPLFGSARTAKGSIAKLGQMGTVPPAPILAVLDAIAFHNAIGAHNKQARLRYLSQYWLAQVRGLPQFKLLTPRDPARSCAIVAFCIEGLPAHAVAAWLLAQQRVFTVVVDIHATQGVRVTPHMLTNTQELDVLVAGIRRLCAMEPAAMLTGLSSASETPPR